jgi:N-acetylglucosamine kinase-like BadF-type ATPase
VAYFLGIDAGGTKTECVVGDATRILGRSTEGTVKIKKVGAATAAVELACTEAKIPPRNLARTCIGISGSSIPEVRDWAYNVLRSKVGGEVGVVGDTVTAHHAAFNGGPGVLVIAGTGSNVLGINERGQTARAGGWGPMISDEGSGFWIGRLAMERAMRAYDAMGSTKLLEGIMRAWKLSNIEDTVTMANSNPPPDFSSLLPAILDSADSGEPLAREILSAAATELANLVAIVLKRLWPLPGPVSVAVTGGVFGHAGQIGQLFAHTLHGERAGLTVNLEVIHPVLGALSMARSGVFGVTA